MTPPPDSTGTQPIPVHPGDKPLWPVRFFLICLVLACLIPGLIGAALLIHHNYKTSRQALEQTSLLTTRALSQAVDSHLQKIQAVAQSLSKSEALRHGHLAGLYEEAHGYLAMSGLASAISLSDENGRLLINTSRPFGAPLPQHGNLQQIKRVFASGQPAISNLFMGSISGQMVISIDVPVFVDGHVAYVLTAVLRPEIFGAFLQSQSLPAQWIAAIFDAEGTFISRTLAPEHFIGKKPSAELLRYAQSAGEGVFESVTPDGIPVLTIFSRSPNTGWFVALGIPRHVYEAEYLRPLVLLVGGTLLLFALGLGLAWMVGDRIAGSVRALAQLARALGRGEALKRPPMHIRESAEVADALVDAALLLAARAEALVGERKEREAELERLVAERTEALCAATEEAERLARCDVLTGLQNRRSANERLRSEFLRMNRTDRPFSALVVDIDHFKRINDCHGHEAGDRALQAIAQYLLGGVRVTDFVARFGGEEFLILLPDTTVDGALIIAEKIRMAVAAAVLPVVTHATVSIGLSDARLYDSSEGDILRRADAALYDAKSKGRNRTCCG